MSQYHALWVQQQKRIDRRETIVSEPYVALLIASNKGSGIPQFVVSRSRIARRDFNLYGPERSFRSRCCVVVAGGNGLHVAHLDAPAGGEAICWYVV